MSRWPKACIKNRQSFRAFNVDFQKPDLDNGVLGGAIPDVVFFEPPYFPRPKARIKYWRFVNKPVGIWRIDYLLTQRQGPGAVFIFIYQLYLTVACMCRPGILVDRDYLPDIGFIIVKWCLKGRGRFNLIQSNCPNGRDRCPNGKKKTDGTPLNQFNVVGP